MPWRWLPSSAAWPRRAPDPRPAPGAPPVTASAGNGPRPGARIRGVLFDVGGTLLRPAVGIGDVLREEAAAAGTPLPPGALAGMGALVGERLAERARAGLPFTFPAAASVAFWTGIYREALDGALPPPAAAALAERAYARMASPAAYALYPDTRPALADLRARGHLLGIVSNWEAWLRTLLEATGLLDVAGDVVVISGEVGLEKPDPRIFARAVDATGLRPDELAYVGDSATADARASRAAGLHAVLLARDDRHPSPDDEGAADLVLDGLGGLPDALDALGTGARR